MQTLWFLMRMLCVLPALLAAVTLLAACQSERPSFKSFDLTGADYGKTLSLIGHDGKPRTLADFQGKVVVLTFGFTQCPDVCPTTLAAVAQAVEQLGADSRRVQVLFVTLDPDRDTREVLASYVPAFDARFLGLYGGKAETDHVAREFKIFYAKREGASQGSYSIDHSAQSYVIDSRGRLRLFVKHERLGVDLVDDLRVLLKEDR